MIPAMAATLVIDGNDVITVLLVIVLGLLILALIRKLF